MKRRHAPTVLFRTTNQYDPQFLEDMQRLHYLFVLGRWGIVVGLWLSVGTASLWFLRHEFATIRQHFTWAAVRYGLAFNMIATLGLVSCLGTTVGLLAWQTQNIFVGLPTTEIESLAQKVAKIREQGNSHPLWRYVCDRPTSM